MKTIVFIIAITLSLLSALSLSQEKAFGADCTGDQVLRMLDAGFSREEVIQICGPVAETRQDRMTYRVTTTSNVRQGPSTEHPVVTTLDEGTLVDVLGKSRSGAAGSEMDWYRIAVNGKELGFISGKLIEPMGEKLTFRPFRQLPASERETVGKFYRSNSETLKRIQVAKYDLDRDGNAELVAKDNDPRACSSSGCEYHYVIFKERDGKWQSVLNEPDPLTCSAVEVGALEHQGAFDILCRNSLDGDLNTSMYRWNGNSYYEHGHHPPTQDDYF
jgi:hypothetical protein